ncbi:two-component system, sporulation sensor kinase A [Oceanobacillus limi]|uniref:histidine kinase n=1 Tax=Oceanobacillus limi TaxID=930131 RepID=A0A1H9Z8R6_9BACI|nr:ATP-binding protein [Oceanobacillus limi]SES77896.1 two-component system, sporulation sensor kinase A [Oceanobacillus limi]
MENTSNKLDKANDHSTYCMNSVDNQDGTTIYTNLSSLPVVMQEQIEDHLNDVILIWDENGIGVYFSKSITSLLGYNLSDLYGTFWKELVAPGDAPLLEDYFSNETNYEKVFNLHLRAKDERYKWCECKIAKVLDETRNQLYYLTTLKDITDKKEIEEIMVRSEKMSIAGQLAAGVAHEIRNPLTSIKGFLQLLQAGVNRKDVYYKIMIDEIEKMEKITSELLFISKPLTDQKEEEAVGQMIEDVVKLLKSQAKLKNITLDYHIDKEHYIHCDRSQIKQVLLNLIKNAIEAMEDPGAITLSVYLVESNVQIDVKDEGPGIPEEVIHKLGEPFFTTKQNGTGLGLMITKQILDRHDATLEILQNEDKGSTFRMTFPAIT